MKKGFFGDNKVHVDSPSIPLIKSETDKKKTEYN